MASSCGGISSTILAVSARNAAVTPGATFAWPAGSGKNRPIALKVSGRHTWNRTPGGMTPSFCNWRNTKCEPTASFV